MHGRRRGNVDERMAQSGRKRHKVYVVQLSAQRPTDNFLLSNGGEQHGNWTLSNALEVEINCVERKSDMLELMRQWSLDKANTEAATTNSWFSSSY
jgi:hypothetical protein